MENKIINPEFIKELKLNISYIKDKHGFYIFDENGAWLQKKIMTEINKAFRKFT